MTPLFERFSSRENLKQAYKYVRNELAKATLSLSPINHPSLTAIDALGDQFFVALEQYLRDGKYTPERGFFVYIPKDNLGLRPVCVLSMIDRIVYQAIFNQDILGFKIDGQLSDDVCFANRINEKRDANDFLYPYINGWDDFCEAQQEAFRKNYVWKAEFDIQQCYEHIPISKLIEKIKNDFNIKDEQILKLLEAQLSTWVEYKDLPKGIPQGPNASSVLGNVYLSSLDKFAEKELLEKELRYIRYVDDIILMGKTKKDILKAVEKMSRFLRNQNLNLNEKTRLTELHDTKMINALRIIPAYSDDASEIPTDKFNLIQKKIPHIVEMIANGENIEKLELRELKYYLSNGTRYDLKFILDLINIIPSRPSLVILIIQYITEGIESFYILDNPQDKFSIITAFWDIYKHDEVSEWSKFWILKMLISIKNITIVGVEEEMERILASREVTIFKIISFYYEAINGRKIKLETIDQTLQESKNEIEKSLYSFFLLNTFDDVKTSTMGNHIEKILNTSSHEMNLIGCYLYQSKPQIIINDIDGIFSSYILKKKQNAKENKIAETTQLLNEDYYLIRKEALLPVASPGFLLGIHRTRRMKNTVSLLLPETIKWEKVKIKMKVGMTEVEIFYNDNYLQTADYKQLGFFTGENQQKLDRQWGFLCALSVLSSTDIKQATANNLRKMIAINSKTTLSTANVHQIKRTLVKRLRALFKTDEDPFNDRKDYYDPKFTILPEVELRQPEIWVQGGKFNENHLSDDNEEEVL